MDSDLDVLLVGSLSHEVTGIGVTGIGREIARSCRRRPCQWSS
ncbi:hypothetical protein GGP66_003000 [Salinibacter ruber]|nr:hypothetical protein [Salinibacter ruber]